MVLVELDVADQRRAGVAGFHQIVAEHAVLRETAGHGLLECIDVVDSFPNKGAFAEQILVHIGNRARVGIDPDVAGKDPTNQERSALGRLTPTRG